ncbi:MAG: NAD(P)H-quinone oxidoreductase, partial [Alphaproteobacteria bacterium]
MTTIPNEMTAIEIAAPGGPEALRPARRPVPRPGPGEVLVKVAAAGLNRADILQRQGKYPPPPGASDIMGLEVAGTVAALGPGARGWREGDAVCALLAGGGYAEYCTAPAVHCLPVPKGFSLVEAGGIVEADCTVWDNVFQRGRLKAGESFLVHGGSSGIGVTAIQTARAFGARVFATAGSTDKCAACERLGAERAINYREVDFVAAVLAATGGRGVDVILDMVGGDYVQRNLSALAIEGRLVHIAFQKGPKAELNLAPLIQKRLTVMGSTLRPRSVEEKAAVVAAVGAKLWPLHEDGRIKVLVHATFPLGRAAEAHRLMESSAHIG